MIPRLGHKKKKKKSLFLGFLFFEPTPWESWLTRKNSSYPEATKVQRRHGDKEMYKDTQLFYPPVIWVFLASPAKHVSEPSSESSIQATSFPSQQSDSEI